MPELKDKMFATWYVLELWQDKLSILWDDVNIQEASPVSLRNQIHLQPSYNYVNAKSWAVKIKNKKLWLIWKINIKPILIIVFGYLFLLFKCEIWKWLRYNLAF